MWPDERLLHLVGAEVPIIQAPMAGAVSAELVVQVCEAGGLGSLPCAMLTLEQARNDTEFGVVRGKSFPPSCLARSIRARRPVTEEIDIDGPRSSSPDNV